MLGNFKYSNPTTLYFGKDALNALRDELKQYGPTIMLSYGGGSIKRNGIYDAVIEVLQSCGKHIVEDAGVMPNPTAEKLREGVNLAKAKKVDLILAVGGGSTIDYAKAVSVAVDCDKDPWTHFFLERNEPQGKVVPVGAILTMVGTGSEMNGGSVITDSATGLKIGHVFAENVFPKFAILNPEFTYTIPAYHMVAGFFDIMSHIMEQYFSNTDDNASDYLAEGLMRSLIHSSRIAVLNSQDYEARSNIMWVATWALNTLISKGKDGDWNVHMLGQAIGGVTNATHGMTLAAVSLPYYRRIMKAGLPKFVRFATNVWNVTTDGRTEEQIAAIGLERLEDWMRELGLVMHAAELGLSEANLEKTADGVFLIGTGYKPLTREFVLEILKASL